MRSLFTRTKSPRAPGCSPGAMLLLLARRRAETGLLRDGGLTPAEVGRYVRQLRKEAAQEVARLLRAT
jgi:hypothetical protein